MTHLITASSARCFRTCPRKYLHKYVEGLRPRIESDALRFGTLIHDALAAWWMRQPWTEPADAEAYDLAKARALMAGYDSRWTMDGFEVLAVEHEFRTPLLDAEGHEVANWSLAGKVDGIAQKADGSKWLIEHKTSSEDVSPGSDYWQRLQIDTQISLYHDGTATLGHIIEGCIYDVLKKPAVRVLTATPEEKRKFTKDGKLYATQRDHDETPAEFQVRCMEAIAEKPAEHYARAEIVRLESELIDARQDLVATVRQIEWCADRNTWPRNDDACFNYGSKCAFFGLCAGRACETDFVQSENPHVELSAA